MHKLAAALLVLVVAAACGGSDPAAAPDSGAPDASAPDAGGDAGAPDAGLDAGPPDAGGDAGAPDAGDAGASDAGLPDAGADGGSPDGGSDGGTAQIGTTPVPIATAGASDELVLAFRAASASRTSWAQAGNEALVLEVLGPHGLIADVVVHQGADGLVYQTQLGKLAAGDVISLRVNPALSAGAATPLASVSGVSLTAVSQLGAAAEGVLNAPIIKWPVQKRFDDLPVLLGWSKAKQHYELYYTDENGGTAALCGGGAKGMQAEIGRWGRGSDDEGIFNYGGAVKTWERCNATSEPYTTLAPQQENLHPILYYGDGHNRLFESRGGYGQVCGTSSDAMANGALEGWNSNNPGNAPSLDAPYVIVLRLVPIDLDSLGFASAYGRREGALDHDAPWMYRLTDSELLREGKIDQRLTFSVEDYLFVDVQANDVDGSGDNLCALSAQGGFKLRAHTSSDNQIHDGMQMTKDYFTGAPGTAWKRLAIPLGAEYTPAQLDQLVFDAYDSDGIFFLAEGDAFMVRPAGDNGASLAYVHQGTRAINVYVDDNGSSCSNGVNSTGPVSGYAYPCAGSAYSFAP